MTNIQEISDNNFKEKVVDTKALTLVDFWATWCGPCRKMSPVLEQIQDDMKDINIFKIDTDQNPKSAMEYGVFSLPTFLIFKDGELKETLVGMMPKSSIVTNIKKYL